jgi:hypothetical protein
MCRDNAEKTSNAAEDVFDHSIQLQQISEEEARQLQNDLRHRRNRDRYERIRTQLLKYYSHITHPQKFDSLIVAFATVYGISMVESLELVRHGEGISRLKQMVEEEKFQEAANAYLKTVARAAATFVKEMQYANEQER